MPASRKKPPPPPEQQRPQRKRSPPPSDAALAMTNGEYNKLPASGSSALTPERKSPAPAKRKRGGGGRRLFDGAAMEQENDDDDDDDDEEEEDEEEEEEAEEETEEEEDDDDDGDEPSEYVKKREANLHRNQTTLREIKAKHLRLGPVDEEQDGALEAALKAVGRAPEADEPEDSNEECEAPGQDSEDEDDEDEDLGFGSSSRSRGRGGSARHGGASAGGASSSDGPANGRGLSPEKQARLDKHKELNKAEVRKRQREEASWMGIEHEVSAVRSVWRQAADRTGHGKPQIAPGMPAGVAPGFVAIGGSQMMALNLAHQLMPGILYLAKKDSKKAVAYAIFASCGYEDDSTISEDEFWYTGQGGNDLLSSKQQFNDQEMTRGNLALKRNMETKLPVRVFRGEKQQGKNRKNDPLYGSANKLTFFAGCGRLSTSSSPRRRAPASAASCASA